MRETSCPGLSRNELASRGCPIAKLQQSQAHLTVGHLIPAWPSFNMFLTLSCLPPVYDLKKINLKNLHLRGREEVKVEREEGKEKEKENTLLPAGSLSKGPQCRDWLMETLRAETPPRSPV